MSPQRHTCFTPLGRMFAGTAAGLPSWLLCLALLLLGTSPHTAHAARRVALLIGNGEYQHENTLPNPVRDVRLLASTLKGMDFKTEVLENLPKRDMDLAIKRFVRESAGADSAILYYAGHGQQPSKGGRSYLLPVNAKVQDDDSLETDGILAEDIAAQLERLPNPAKLRLVILDACRNTRATTRSTVRGLAPPARTDSYTLIAYSTDANSVAQDGSGANSPYAKALAKHLPRALTEPVRLVFEDTAKDVRTETRQQQLPRTYGDLESRVRLDGVQVTSVTPVATGLPVQVQPDAEQEAWEIAKRRDTVASYGVYLNRYPSGRYAQTARDALEGLQPAPQPVQAVQAASPAQQPPAQASMQPGHVFRDCTGAHCPEMVVIPAGSFVMGSHDGDADEKPPHRVNIRSFALGRFEVTQGQWQAVMGRNPSYFKDCGENCPVEQVSWDDIQQYLVKLSGMTGMKYRLASEAEWEYAARAGSTGKYSWGNEIGRNQANCDGCGSQWDNKSTAPVGSFSANPFGLHDMHGNVWEWVEDVWHDGYAGAPTEGSAWTGAGDSSRRVLRGGSWDAIPGSLRSFGRYWYTPDNRGRDSGLRLARNVS